MREEIVESRGEEEMSGNNEIRLKRKRCTIVRGGQGRWKSKQAQCETIALRELIELATGNSGFAKRDWTPQIRYKESSVNGKTSTMTTIQKRQLRNFCAVLRDSSLPDSYNSITLKNLELLKTRWTIEGLERRRLDIFEKKPKELVSRLTTWRKLNRINRSLTINQTTVGSNQEILSPEARVE